MRVIVHHRVRSSDGMAVHLHAMLSAFRQTGHEATLVGPALVGAVDPHAPGDPAGRMRRSLPRGLAEALEFGYGLFAAARLLAAIVRFRPDVIYERFNLFFPFGALLARCLSIRYVLEVNSPLHEQRSATDGLFLSWLSRWSQRYCWRRADLCLPVSQVMAGRLCDEGVSRDRILVLHNGVDRSVFHAQPDPDAVAAVRSELGLGRSLVIGFVGYVRPWHRVDWLIRLLASGRLPDDTRVLIVGEGAALLALTAGGAGFGAWMAAMIGVDVPNSQLKRFEQAITAGNLLMPVDVPRDRQTPIEAVIRDGFPAAEFTVSRPTSGVEVA